MRKKWSNKYVNFYLRMTWVKYNWCRNSWAIDNKIVGHIRAFVWYNYHYFNRSPGHSLFRALFSTYLFEKCLPTCSFQIHWLKGAREYSRCRGTIVHCKQEDLKLAQTTLGQGQCIELQGDAKNIIGPYPLRCTECIFFLLRLSTWR
jgi:hypothetical protein